MLGLFDLAVHFGTACPAWTQCPICFGFCVCSLECFFFCCCFVLRVDWCVVCVCASIFLLTISELLLAFPNFLELALCVRVSVQFSDVARVIQAQVGVLECWIPLPNPFPQFM